MSISSGTKTALGEAASWALAGVMIAGAIVYFDELKSVFSLGPPASSDQVKTATAPRAPQPIAKSSKASAQTSSSGYLVKLKAGPYGHYKAPARFNGRTVEVLVDTGASFVALTHEDAERAGIFIGPGDYSHRTQTANGQAKVAMVNIHRISIGDIEVRNVRATVHEPGKLHVTLLGMSFLSKLRRAEIRRGQLILEH